MNSNFSDLERLAAKLAALHEQDFGGKQRGRYRISQKFMRHIAGRKRLYPEMIAALWREMFERGYALIDMDDFFVVMSVRTFSTYRRVGSSVVGEPRKFGEPDKDDQSDE